MDGGQTSLAKQRTQIYIQLFKMKKSIKKHLAYNRRELSLERRVLPTHPKKHCIFLTKTVVRVVDRLLLL
jgi:hypothetical protein